jgi:Flp pilus assembly protein TadD
MKAQIYLLAAAVLLQGELLGGQCVQPAAAKTDGRSGMWRSSGQGAPSVEACRKRAAAHPQDADAQNDLGWALRQAGDLKGAEQALSAALKLAPGMPQAHSNLSVVALDEHNNAQAVSEGKEAVSLDGKQPIFHVVLGNALSASGDRASAIKEYQEALKLRPDYENAMYHLGETLYAEGQTGEAKKQLSFALGLDPQDERALQLLDKIMKTEKQ